MPSLRTAGTLALEPLNADGVRAFARLYAGETETSTCRSSACWQPAAACRERCTAWRRSGRACWSCAASPIRSAASPPTGPGCAPPRTTSSEASSSCRPPGSAPSPERGPARMSARTRGWPLSRPPTRASSSGASGSWPSWSRASTGSPVPGDRRARPAAGSPRSLHAGLLAALAAGVLPGSEAGRSPCCGPGSIRCARSIRRSRRRPTTAGWSWRSISSRRCSRPAATRRSARRSSTRSWPAVRDARRRTLVVVAVRADFYGRCAAYPELSRLLGAGHVLVGPMLRRGAAPCDRAAGPPGRPAGRARAGRRAGRRRRGPARGAAAGLVGAAGAVAAPRRRRAAACPTTSRPGACAGRSRGWPSRPTSGSTPRAGGSPGGSCCAWPARARATPSCGAAPA